MNLCDGSGGVHPAKGLNLQLFAAEEKFADEARLHYIRAGASIPNTLQPSGMQGVHQDMKRLRAWLQLQRVNHESIDAHVKVLIQRNDRDRTERPQRFPSHQHVSNDSRAFKTLASPGTPVNLLWTFVTVTRTLF